MKLAYLAICVLLSGTVVGCSSNVAMLRDESGGYRQERLLSACDDPQLCGSARLYDVNWLSCNDYPVDYRSKTDSYTPSKTQYIYQQRVVVNP
jgi:hypothetical protein